MAWGLSHASCKALATPFSGKLNAPQACALLGGPWCAGHFSLPHMCVSAWHLPLCTSRGVNLRWPCPNCRGTHGGHHGGHFPHGVPMPEDSIGKWRPLPEGVASSRSNVMANGCSEHQVGLLSPAARPAAQTKPQQSLCSHPCWAHPPHDCRHCRCRSNVAAFMLEGPPYSHSCSPRQSTPLFQP